MKARDEYLAKFIGQWAKPDGDSGGPYRVKRAWVDEKSIIRVVCDTPVGEQEFRAQDCEFNKEKDAL
jgi:hypothetical protein